MLEKSTPNIDEFNPWILPFHAQVIRDVEQNLDYSIGTHELLFSGSIGSGKSLLAANIALAHAIRFKGAKILIGRRSLPDLKDTIFQKIVEHLEGTALVDGVDYNINYSSAYIEFKNGSIIMGKSWADKKYRKFRSLELSMAIIEEAIENEGDDYKAMVEIRQRVGRQPHIKKNLIIYCTNPGSPAHPLYKYFFETESQTRHVYFSLTEQNPFLPPTYIEQLKKDLPPKEAERMLYGKWVEIDKERIYYAYNSGINFKKTDYNINFKLPISISWDFNIGHLKPLSLCCSQYDPKTDTFHFFEEVVVHGFRTLDALEELQARGILDYPASFEIHGDATGGARSTNSLWSNYEIINNYLSNYRTASGLKCNFKLLIPKSNPPIRERHNIVNAYCANSLGENRLFVYKKCKTVDEGMNRTALKKGSEYIENDADEFQHITTSLGYRVVYTSQNKVIIKGGNI